MSVCESGFSLMISSLTSSIRTIIIMYDNAFKTFMLLFRKWACREMQGYKQKSGGRDKDSSPVHQDVIPTLDQRESSSSGLDKRDKEIISFAGYRPATLLNISEKTDIPFVECLHRTKRLQKMGYLKRVEGAPDSAGLYLYLATRKQR